MSATSVTASDIRMDYMRLLVAQMQNQNPLEPLDNNEMASQLAQFSQLQQLESMNSSFAEVLSTTNRSYANSLLGRTVTFYSEDETTGTFEKKTGIVLNKVPGGIIATPDKRKALFEKLREIHNVPIIEIIPCFCEVLEAGGTYIFAAERPDHPFTAILDEVATKIEKF